MSIEIDGGAMRVIQVDSYVDRTAMRYVDLCILGRYTKDLVAKLHSLTGWFPQ